MKKIAILLLTVFLLIPGYTYAQEETETRKESVWEEVENVETINILKQKEDGSFCIDLKEVYEGENARSEALVGKAGTIDAEFKVKSLTFLTNTLS